MTSSQERCLNPHKLAGYRYEGDDALCQGNQETVASVLYSVPTVKMTHPRPFKYHREQLTAHHAIKRLP